MAQVMLSTTLKIQFTIKNINKILLIDLRGVDNMTWTVKINAVTYNFATETFSCTRNSQLVSPEKNKRRFFLHLT